MVQATELKQRFKHIANTSFAEQEEMVRLLFETEWIRILVVRNSETPAQFSFEVELALPSRIIEPRESHDGPGGTGRARAFVERTIQHLEYMLHLEAAGLSLGVVSKDGIWTASVTTSQNPSSSFFESLIPPV